VTAQRTAQNIGHNWMRLAFTARGCARPGPINPNPCVNLSVDVRFVSKRDRLLRRRKVTRCANIDGSAV
jgi:hypothetical protein